MPQQYDPREGCSHPRLTPPDPPKWNRRAALALVPGTGWNELGSVFLIFHSWGSGFSAHGGWWGELTHRCELDLTNLCPPHLCSASVLFGPLMVTFIEDWPRADAHGEVGFPYSFVYASLFHHPRFGLSRTNSIFSLSMQVLWGSRKDASKGPPCVFGRLIAKAVRIYPDPGCFQLTGHLVPAELAI